MKSCFKYIIYGVNWYGKWTRRRRRRRWLRKHWIDRLNKFASFSSPSIVKNITLHCVCVCVPVSQMKGKKGRISHQANEPALTYFVSLCAIQHRSLAEVCLFKCYLFRKERDWENMIARNFHSLYFFFEFCSSYLILKW